MNSKNKFILAVSGVIVVVIFWIGWVSINNDESSPAMVKFLSIQQLQTDNTDTRVKLGGNVKPGTIIISEDDMLDAEFVIEQGEFELPVRYRGSRPDLFKDGAEVIVEGVYKDGKFQADMLQTKCASRYEGDLRNEASYDTNTMKGDGQI